MKGPSLLRIPGSFSAKVTPQTFNRIVRIRDLLGRAIGEVQTDKKRDSSKSPLPFKRASDESSEAESIQ